MCITFFFNFVSRLFGVVQVGHEEDDASYVLPQRGGNPRAGNRSQTAKKQTTLQKKLCLLGGKF